MKLVVDIHERDYLAIRDGFIPFSVLLDSVKNGVPLPEQHGKLVDKERLIITLCLNLLEGVKMDRRDIDIKATISVKVTAEEVERLSPEELTELVQFRLYKAVIKGLKEAREENKVDS